MTAEIDRVAVDRKVRRFFELTLEQLEHGDFTFSSDSSETSETSENSEMSETSETTEGKEAAKEGDGEGSKLKAEVEGLLKALLGVDPAADEWGPIMATANAVVTPVIRGG